MEKSQMITPFTQQPWLQMWFHPRRSVREIVDTNPHRHLLWLSFIYGCPLILGLMQALAIGQALQLWGIITMAVILSPLVGFFLLSFFSGILFWTGSWLDGHASYGEVRAALAWSNITGIINIGVWIAMISAFGISLFIPEMTQVPPTDLQKWIWAMATLVQFAAGIWSFILLMLSLAEVEKFSVWRGFVSFVCASLIMGLIAWVVLSLLVV